jgi:coenzyme F420-reducing hydrogenase alpha subunit
MLQKLSDNIAECLTHAVEAQARADQATDMTTKRENAAMAERWRRLAESYQFVERISRFLDNTRAIGSMPSK